MIPEVLNLNFSGAVCFVLQKHAKSMQYRFADIGVTAKWKASRLDSAATAFFQLKSPQKLTICLSLNF